MYSFVSGAVLLSANYRFLLDLRAMINKAVPTSNRVSTAADMYKTPLLTVSDVAASLLNVNVVVFCWLFKLPS